MDYYSQYLIVRLVPLCLSKVTSKLIFLVCHDLSLIHLVLYRTLLGLHRMATLQRDELGQVVLIPQSSVVSSVSI